MITDIIESRLREYLKGLQLTRDFLRTIQQQPMFMLNTQNFFVRLNMGSRYFLYVAAQIVNITGDELQVRGVDKHMPNKVQSTKLAYVSNASFKEEEITDLMTKLRQESILVCRRRRQPCRRSRPPPPLLPRCRLPHCRHATDASPCGRPLRRTCRLARCCR